MSSQEARKGAEESDIRPIERNLYFNGKLMTARDMQVEQDYHRARLHEISQHVLGAGLVSGLETKVTEEDQRLYADIEPGLGLDRYGRPVFVDEGDGVAIKAAEPEEEEGSKFYNGDEIYLFLNYDECRVDPVPVPGSGNGCEERCCCNRVIEDFEVVYTREQPKRYKEVPKIKFPPKDRLDLTDDQPYSDDPALMEMARSYYRNEREKDYEPNTVQCESDRDCSLFLGKFLRRSEAWNFVDDFEDCRPFVYTNDMLYAIIARHVTDFNNPHEVEEGLKEIEGVSNPGGNIDLRSPEGTISFETSKQKNKENEYWVAFDVTDRVAHRKDVNRLNDRIEELEDCVEDLKACLTEVVDHLREEHADRYDQDEDTELFRTCNELCEDRDSPKQDSRRQERQEENDDDEYQEGIE